MNINNKNILIERTTNPKDASKLYNILQSLLLTPDNYRNQKKSKLEKLSKEGYIIGNHSEVDLEEMIQTPKNYIFVAKDKQIESIVGNIIAYSLILRTDEIIKEVQHYADQVDFTSTKAKKYIGDGNFIYLIQIAIKKGYSNQGIGSKIMNFSFKKIDVPIISFVMKSPLRNEISINFHLKNGFQHFGDYFGEYDGFPNYRSAGFIHFPKK